MVTHGPDDAGWNPTDPVRLPIDGTLDLHTFHPRDVKALLPDYLQECRRKGILDVRIVHGKGTEVESFRLAGEDAGSWGATLVRLRPA
jgi:DNA-nicking Smr family endonuclease